ncbi:hypothetical protein [Candidatus Borrarchaeum sp.]|uniref:hypothetical protein n=1 Tax=Candidatus Borrarchaeum sp. TaxID=2846742 RepID=UPI00257FBAC3|nr:hypothetical protein [Candidatus Borrarchaeum sp.]
MGRTREKFLLSILSVFMVCLLASTATTTVAAGEWGNLAVGDTMEWDTDATTVMEDESTWSLEFTTQMEILEINDGTVRAKTAMSLFGSTFTSTETDDDWRPFLYSQSQLEGAPTENYNFDGNNYEAANINYEETEDGTTWTMEVWIDSGTGILFEAQGSSDRGDSLEVQLVSTTANLTSAGGLCLGTLLIAFASVATLVVISLVRYHKK